MLAPETAAPESVIGADGRTQVTSPTITNYPSRAIGYIQSVFDGATYACTGWLIAPDFILTAGHCVFFDPPGGSDEIREYPESATFTPASNGGSSPYPTCPLQYVYTTQAWLNDATATPQQDFAGVQLAHTGGCDTIGNTVGWLGFLAHSDRDHFTNAQVHIRGYPVDKPYATMWTMKGPIQASQKQMFFYKMDTFGGQSGSPVLRFENPAGPLPEGWYGLGIHTYGNGLSFQPCNCNAATRITNARVGLIQGWMDAD